MQKKPLLIGALLATSILASMSLALASTSKMSSSMQDNIDAASVLYQKGITKTEPTKTPFYENISRKDAAILLKRFATSVLHKTSDIETCNYTDLQKISAASEQDEVVAACNLGLFKAGTFAPYDYFTNGQLVTVIARMISSNAQMEEAEAYDYLLHVGILHSDDKKYASSLAMRKDVYSILQKIIVSISQFAAYSPYIENFTVGNTIGSASDIQIQDSANKVYKVMVYQKDKVYGNYELLQLGSSVVIAPGLLITNAHVIYNDDEDAAYNNIEICAMNNKNNKVRCFTTARVVYYDKDKDLALLKVADASGLSKPAQLASQAPHNGDSVNVRGYPGIGGQSITYTKGIISGIERDKYKSDVKIDHGNSGGGAFNKKGELIGIPNSAQVDTNTLSYIIPYETVKAFLGEKGSIVTNSGASDASFASYVQSLQVAKNTNTIQNPVFSLADTSDYILDDYSFDASRNLHNLSLSTADSTLSITINNSTRIGAGTTREQKDAQYNEDFKNCESNTTGDIVVNSKTWEYNICSKYYGRANNIAYVSYKTSTYPTDISILSKNPINTKILQNIMHKITLATSDVKLSIDPYTIGPAKLTQTPNATLWYNLSQGGNISTQIKIIHNNTFAAGNVVVQEQPKENFNIQIKNKSYYDFIKDNTDFYTNGKYFDVLLSGGLYKNSMGNTFYILANSSKQEDLSNTEEPTRTISVLAYTKKDDKIYLFGIDFVYQGEQDSVLENQIIKYINTIKIDGAIPMPTLGAEVRDVNSILLSR